ncbi:hypothetical protein GGI12_002780 [Dipsacomyces acuminosporus]|nr:hypothetical protein GGI12_002780 [Dipsacomyces acuminosporus]
MAVDKNSRFLGSAEITYRLADDARSAIQSFDGETLYGADLANVEPLRVTYSDPEKSMFLDDLKFENSLPTPNDVPMGHRLGLHPVQLAHMQSALQQTYSQSQYADAYNASRRSQSGGGYNRRQAGNKGSTNEPKSTSEQLDADLDAYMRIDAENENSSSRNSNPGTEAKPDIAAEAPAPAPAEE